VGEETAVVVVVVELEVVVVELEVVVGLKVAVELRDLDFVLTIVFPFSTTVVYHACTNTILRISSTASL
jgi:hypothetical protein